jgi:hypothetical protein
MRWRVVENKTCGERCDECRRDGHECLRRWYVIDDGRPVGVDSLVASGFTCREEAEAYVKYPEIQQHPQPRH